MTSIDKKTLSFLKSLSKNNNRDWFHEHKNQHDEAKKNVKEFAESLKEKLNNHDHIETAKVMRIYRDIRFSKDKTPYKTNFGISFNRATAARRGGMYIHIHPGDNFVGGGFWGPERDDLLRIRKELAADASEFRKIISDKNFIKYFGTLQGEELKTAPRGFDKEHKDIDLIRKKQYLISRSFTDEEVMANNFIDECDKTFQAMRPFFDYMSHVLTTNENGESII